MQRECLKECEIVISPLREPALLSKIENWKVLLSGCYGPYRRNSLMQNDVGGDVSIAMNFTHLMDHVRPSNKILQILLTSTKNHCRSWKDFGFFASLMSVHLLHLSIKSELAFPIVAVGLEHLCEVLMIHLREGCKSCKVSGSNSNVRELLGVVRTVLASKVSMYLNELEIEHLATLCLKASLSTLSDRSNMESLQLANRTTFILNEGVSLNCDYYEGILHLVSDNEVTLKENASLNNQKIFLCCVSLAGDDENLLCADICYTSQTDALEKIVIDRAKQLCDNLTKLDVKVIACQKVIHPTIKKMFRKANIIALDRLGKQKFDMLHLLTGGLPLGLLDFEVDSSMLGNVESICTIQMHGKRYLKLSSTTCNFGSIVLHGFHDALLQQLKSACQQAIHSSYLYMLKSELCVGAGCLETHLLFILEEVNMMNADGTETVLSRHYVQNVTSMFRNALLFSVKSLYKDIDELWIDTDHGHLFLNNSDAACACGLVPRPEHLVFLASSNCTFEKTKQEGNTFNLLPLSQKSIMDVHSAKVAAYQTIFEILPLVLRIGVAINDKN